MHWKWRPYDGKLVEALEGKRTLFEWAGLNKKEGDISSPMFSGKSGLGKVSLNDHSSVLSGPDFTFVIILPSGQVWVLLGANV